jgi:uncharacterized protein YceK
MSRVVVTITTVLILAIIGCSDKQEKIEPKEDNKTVVADKNMTKESNTTKTDSNETKKNMMVIQEEFIPEHIRRSHIEVVPH